MTDEERVEATLTWAAEDKHVRIKGYVESREVWLVDNRYATGAVKLSPAKKQVGHAWICWWNVEELEPV